MRKLLIVTTIVVLIASLTVSTVLAAKPGSAPPSNPVDEWGVLLDKLENLDADLAAVSAGVDEVKSAMVRMEGGYGSFLVDTYVDPAGFWVGYTDFGPYDEMRHISVTARAMDFADIDVTVSARWETSGNVLIVSELPPSDQVIFEFDAMYWRISGRSNSSGGEVEFQYTVTYSAATE